MVSRVRKKSDKMSLKLSESNTIRLIQLYQGEPSLYDSSWDDYRNRDLRAAALGRICAGLSVQGFGPKEVATKFKNLRNSYSQELKKIQDSEKSGAENVYVPKVYWFDLMDSFLRSQMYTRSSRSSMSLEQTPNMKEEVILPEAIQAIKVEVQEDNTSVLYDSMNDQVYPEDTEEGRGAVALKKLKTGKNSPQLEGCSSETSSFSNKSRIRRKTPSRTRKPGKRGIFPAGERARGRTGPSLRSRDSDMFGSFGQFVAGVLRRAGHRRAIVMTSEITGVLMRHMTATSRPASPPDSHLSSDFS